MTEYELQELAFSAAGLAATFTTLLITIISGYLLVAYVAGRDLSRAQVTLINILFAFTSALFLGGSVSSFSKQLNIVKQLRVINPDNFYPMTTFTVISCDVIFSLIILPVSNLCGMSDTPRVNGRSGTKGPFR
jgi:hypothetical protein